MGAAPPMTAAEFAAIGGFIQAEFGIKMPPAKKIMLQSRLLKRLRAMNMSSYRQYREYLFSPEGMAHELPLMIDAVTTNKTDFFRISCAAGIGAKSRCAWCRNCEGSWPSAA